MAPGSRDHAPAATRCVARVFVRAPVLLGGGPNVWRWNGKGRNKNTVDVEKRPKPVPLHLALG